VHADHNFIAFTQGIYNYIPETIFLWYVSVLLQLYCCYNIWCIYCVVVVVIIIVVVVAAAAAVVIIIISVAGLEVMHCGI